MISITKIIEETIRNRPKDAHRDYIGASQIGNPCDRSIWYEFNCFDREVDRVKVSKTYDVGRNLEHLIARYISESGIWIDRPDHAYSDKEIPQFRGHIDGLLRLTNQEPIVIEIKTCKASSFARFVKHGLKKWSPNYYDQMQSYLGMTGYQNGVLLAFNKDDSQLHEEWVEFDCIHYEMLKDKVKRIITSEDAPDRINRSPLFHVCQMCNFRKVCNS